MLSIGNDSTVRSCSGLVSAACLGRSRVEWNENEKPGRANLSIVREVRRQTNLARYAMSTGPPVSLDSPVRTQYRTQHDLPTTMAAPAPSKLITVATARCAATGQVMREEMHGGGFVVSVPCWARSTIETIWTIGHVCVHWQLFVLRSYLTAVAIGGQRVAQRSGTKLGAYLLADGRCKVA